MKKSQLDEVIKKMVKKEMLKEEPGVNVNNPAVKNFIKGNRNKELVETFEDFLYRFSKSNRTLYQKYESMLDNLLNDLNK